ncbi:unnamed protein product [Rangifer tarandus platyrhynchus]|uniref:Uncharacterized protein n=1 Tax=Rangifer tarandus platyrhynchus TaxID=3082113 RepID=A0AC60A6A6_RANTA
MKAHVPQNPEVLDPPEEMLRCRTSWEEMRGVWPFCLHERALTRTRRCRVLRQRGCSVSPWTWILTPVGRVSKVQGESRLGLRVAHPGLHWRSPSSSGAQRLTHQTFVTGDDSFFLEFTPRLSS